MFTFDSKHTRIRYKIRAQQQQETFEVVNRRQFGGNLISIHSQAPHVQGHFEIWKQVFTHSLEEKREAMVYFNNNGVPKQIEQPLNKIFKEKPNDILGYMVRCMVNFVLFSSVTRTSSCM